MRSIVIGKYRCPHLTQANAFGCKEDVLCRSCTILHPIALVFHIACLFHIAANYDGDFLNAAAVYGQGIESILSFNSSVFVSNRENAELYCMGNFYDYVQFVEGQTLYGAHNVGYIYKWNIDVLTAVESADATTATFSVYPNPFNDFLHINLSGKAAKV